MPTSIKKVAAAAALAGLIAGPLSVFAAPDGPTVMLSSSAPFTAAVPTNVTWATPIPVSVSISSSTTDFDAADVSVVGAMGVENFSGSGSSYTFNVVPGDGDPLHANQPRYVRIEVHADKFGGNQASNVIEFWFDPSAAPVDSTAPSITFTSDSTPDGATVATANASTTTASAHFGWTIDDASSTVRCSITDASSSPSYFGCGSPQDYTLPAGTYRFVVEATDGANNAASSTRMFSIVMGTTTPATTTTPNPTPTPAPSGGGGGGGGNGMIVGSSPSAPGGSGTGSFFNPNLIVPTVPTGPTPAVATQAELNALAAADAAQNTPAPTAVAVSGSPRAASGASLVAQSQPSAAETPVPPAPTTTEPNTPAVPNTADQQAAAGGVEVPPSFWLWSLVALVLVAALGWFFYRSV